MVKRHKTYKNWYLFNMVLFIGFAFEFFIRGDKFLGGVLIFTGLINLIAFQQIPRKISTITVTLNLFNGIVATVVGYNYVLIDYVILLGIWFTITFGYAVAVIRQIINLILRKQYKSKMKERSI